MTYVSRADEADWKYPLPQKANAEGRLAVDGHHIYWHEYGNPEGEPLLFIHGGPGGASSPANARYFNPERYRILLFDQRGCGQSIPHAAQDPKAALTGNTTGHLIADIEALRGLRGIRGKMHVFGGSWGSTLALAYAIAHPRHVATLILRGIFLCRRADIDYFYQGNAAYYHQNPHDSRRPGAYMFFPEAWKPYVEVIPVKERLDMVKAYARIFAMTPATEAQARRQEGAAVAWAVWEGNTSFLASPSSDPGHFADPAFARAFARIENHYFMNGAFLGGRRARDNNYLLDHVKAIAHIPAHVVQGQYDQVCPCFGADALVAALKKHKAKVDYILTPAGHASLERDTLRALTQIMDALP
jgi:proline iminopeptidase